MRIDLSNVDGLAFKSYERLCLRLEDLRNRIKDRTELDRNLTELELERESTKNEAAATVREAYESLSKEERKKVSEPTEHDLYMAAEHADREGEFPKRIVQLNRSIKVCGMDIETLSYEINIETNWLRYLTQARAGIKPDADPGVIAPSTPTETVGDPGRVGVGKAK